MTALATRLRTAWALGPANISRVLAYRFRLKLGIHPVQRAEATLPTEGPFFAAPTDVTALPAPDHWRTETLLFGIHRRPMGDGPPEWTADPLHEEQAAPTSASALAPWWTIGDFAGADIKRRWEYSRFDWTLAFAQQARAGEPGAFERLEHWLGDWAQRNPPYRGPNWKCAQEASIRLLHISLGAMLLGTESDVTEAMRSVIEAHVQRILPTLSYARAQDNNHATSEAGALFVAGAWLHLAKLPGAEALLRRGRTLVERTTLRLFAPDGSFSQYSVNYHRLALDTLSIVEVWRRRANLPPFTLAFQERVRAAADWLRIMVDPKSGDAPNLGANDGANLLALTNARYRDFRPSAQLATVLFAGCRAFAPGPWDDALAWLGVDVPAEVAPLPDLAIFDDGGFAVLRRGAAMAMLRYPRFRFRPGHADALHVDLWHDGDNLLRDDGSYSYNTEQVWMDCFGCVQSHNTIQFDGAPQMVRLSRFLLGDWLSCEDAGETADGFSASYRSRSGWRHHREIALRDALIVIDTVEGFSRDARLRWRLAPRDWRMEAGAVTDGRHRLSIRADVPITLALVEGWESRHYLERTPIPVLEATITRPGRIESRYRWAP